MPKVNLSNVAGNRAKYERISFSLLPSATVEKNITGEFIYCVESNIGFDFALDDDRPIESDIGIEYRQEPGEAFTKIRITNTNTTQTLTCSFLYGYGKIEDRRLVPVAGRRVGIFVEDYPTQFLSSGITSIAASANQDFDGIATGTQRQRKSLTITNQEAVGGNVLEIHDSLGNIAQVIFPQNSIIFNTSDYIRVHNASGSTITCKIQEIWYTNG